MSRAISQLRNSRRTRLIVITLLVLAGLSYVYLPKAYGAQLLYRQLLLSDNRPSVTATYQLGFQIQTAETLGSLKFQICSNDPLINDVCTVPTGFDIASAVLSAQSGVSGFSVLASQTNAYTMVLTRNPSVVSGGNILLTFQGVINPSSAGTYYGRLQTFTSTDASGSYNDYGGIAFSIINPFQISSTVPPYLLFCTGVTITNYNCATASGDYVDFGNFSDHSTASAQTQMVTATNANNGYVMYVYGTTMTSGNNIINSMNTADVSRPGVSQFGMNLVANQTPLVGTNPLGSTVAAPTAGYNQPNFFKFNSGDEIVTANQPTGYTKFTNSYIVNIPSGQAPGVYATTLTYICLANF